MGIVHYTVAVDIWSVGCIMAELALLQPIFVGANDGDQLFAILKVLGSLTKEDESIFTKRVPFELSIMTAFHNFKKVSLL
jgi:serine/threonine protein kinase